MDKAPSFDEDASGMSATDASSSYRDRAFKDEAPSASSVAVGAEEAVTDLMDMEKIQEEAERMKGLGNRHMAAQEYMRAYNAYSAALELNPVGPSSHVFLSNRAAALLSLKRYAAASLDAKRAVALAPTFGKAHARLGQARYFLKDYEGAVAAYEQAVHFEPDNAVTWTYLAKAKNKLARQQGGDTDSAFSSMNDTVVNSIATDTLGKAGIVSGYGSMGRPNRHATRAIPSIQQEMSRLSVKEDQPPTEVETGPMGPVGIAGRQVSALAMSSVSNVGLLNTGPSAVAAIDTNDDDDDEEDPDFDEALRLQRKANRFLANKQYRHAVDEFSAALFLVPDDENLSPQLYIGRAHALNGARRHTSALNDARQALQLSPNNSEAHCTKARSLFYVQNYADAIEAFEVSIELLGSDQRLSVLDQAYLQKARKSLQEQQMKDLEESYSADLTSPMTTMPVIPETPQSQYNAYIGPLGGVTSPLSASSVTSPSERSNSSIPKLNPPRFVPREQVISSTPNLPPMPKSWPQQSPSSPTFFRVGPERTVTFISEAMGIKLNRGSDGFVRVLKVTPLQKGSPLMREGDIQIGDVVREAAGVDLRRPLTNIMWGDTVALMKMTPRPIDLIVAPELSEAPPSVAEEFAKARAALKVESVLLNQSSSRSYSSYNIRPSPGNGEEPVAESIAAQDERGVTETTVIDENDLEIIETSLSKEGTEENHIDVAPQEIASSEQNEEATDSDSDDTAQEICPPTTHTPRLDKEEGETDEQVEPDFLAEENAEEDGEGIEEPEPDCSVEEIAHHEEAQYHTEEEASVLETCEETLTLKAEVLFGSGCSHGWTNERWMSVPPLERKLRHYGTVSRLTKGRFVWSSEQYVPRTLAIFEHPNLILVLRVPTSVEEVRSLLNLPKGVAINGDTGKENLMDSFLVAESVIDPSTCKLRLSPLTTITSVSELCNKKVDSRRRSCFELLTPSETIAVYPGIVTNEAVDSREEADTPDLRDSSGIILETTNYEEAIGKALQNAHEPHQRDPVGGHSDYAWKHQVILGTLHSFAVSGNVAMLKNAIQAAKENPCSTGATVTDSVPGQQFLDPKVIDSKDEGGKTALHYACQRRNSAAVSLLVDAGANCSISLEPDMSSPCHLAARVLDDKSLSTILATKYPIRPDANTLNASGETPMYVAAVEGRTLGGSTTPIYLGRCLSALEAWDGKFLADDSKLVNPVSAVSSQWRSSELDVILSHCHFLYPLIGANNGISVGALFHYPVHMALISLRKQLMLIRTGKSGHIMFGNKDHSLASTLRVLMEHGFEPNERLESNNVNTVDFFDSFGLTPLQILAAAAMDADDESMAHINASTLRNIAEALSDSAEILVRYGGRIYIDPPPNERLNRIQPPLPQSKDSQTSDTTTNLPHLNRSNLQIDSNAKLMNFFGGSERLGNAKKEWDQFKQVPSVGKLMLHRLDSTPLVDSDAPGGSDEKSCAICWKAFGTIRNRKHKCRVSKRYVCDDCSGKRVVEGKEEFRVSDGQFNVAKIEAGKDRARQSEIKAQEGETDTGASHVRRLRVSHEQKAKKMLEKQEAVEKEELFGGVMGKAMSFIMGEDDEREGHDESIGNMAATLGQTRDALNERGEKLNSLGDKTAALAQKSLDFANLTKELEKQQSSFW